MNGVTNFLGHIERNAKAFLALNPKDIVLLHHNDTDGLSSGAILWRAFSRAGYTVRRYAFEKPYPVAVQKLFKDPQLDAETIFVVTDFGSGMLETFAALCRDQSRFFLLDHHGLQGQAGELMHIVNCLPFGIEGSKQCSASAIAALFVQHLGKYNVDLLRLGVLGAFGDGQDLKEGMNGCVWGKAHALGDVADKDGIQVRCGNWMEAEALKKSVDSLGSIGYFRGGVDIALRGLLEGYDDACAHYANQFINEYENALSMLTNNLQLTSGAATQALFLGPEFEAMGVKTVGLVCDQLKSSSRISDSKYLLGFQSIRPEIPGLGPIELSETKVSFRLPPELEKKVRSNEMPSLQVLVPVAAQAVGGFVDANHIHAGACTVSKGREQDLIKEFEEAVSKHK